MTKSKMIVPKTITVGYNSRNDTYTGKLAYVIYTDDKGTLRKEASWQSWRNKDLGSDNYDNVPTEGFVLNKGVGGARMSYGWNARNEYIRVYDPRNFEFEISVKNLLFILQECSAIKGKGLEGEFVYAWDGVELVLLPVNCKEYEECVKHTQRQTIKFDKNEIKEGCSYLMKDGTETLYLGRLNYNKANYYSKNFNPAGKKHIFLNLSKSDYKYNDQYFAESGFTRIAETISSEPLPQFPEEYDNFKKSIYCGDYSKIKLIKEKIINKFYRQKFILKEDNKYYVVIVNNNNYYNYYSECNKDITLNRSKEFIPEIINGKFNFPKVESLSQNKVNINSLDLYKAIIITNDGVELNWS